MLAAIIFTVLLNTHPMAEGMTPVQQYRCYRSPVLDAKDEQTVLVSCYDATGRAFAVGATCKKDAPSHESNEVFIGSPPVPLRVSCESKVTL